MINKNSKLNVSDNSGAFKSRCIHVYNKTKSKHGKVGDIIKVVVTKLKRTGNIRVKKKKMYNAIIVATKKTNPIFSGNTLKIHENSIILIDNNRKKTIGTRITRKVDRNLRQKHLLKSLLLSIYPKYV